MQRTENQLIVIACDFCCRDWDGQEAMIEGHHGSILCLECLKMALKNAAASADKYTCTLCLRSNIAGSEPRWSQPDTALGSTAIACKDCLTQSAKAFSKNPDIDWTWDGVLITR